MKVPGSVDTASSAFDLFEAAPTHSSSVSSTLAEFTPTSSLTGTRPIEIVVPTTSGSYLDLARSYFHVHACVQKTNDTAFSNNRDNPAVYPGDLLMHYFFRTVELCAQDKTLEYASDYK